MTYVRKDCAIFQHRVAASTSKLVGTFEAQGSGSRNLKTCVFHTH